jgi:hypothetical protein
MDRFMQKPKFKNQLQMYGLYQKRSLQFELLRTKKIINEPTQAVQPGLTKPIPAMIFLQKNED